MALDDVCAALGLNRTFTARQVVASRIIELAQRGGTQPDQAAGRLLAEANGGSER